MMTMAEKLSPGLSVTQARRLLVGLLREDGIESADLDARLLIEAALAIDHAALASQSDRILSMAEAHAISVFATRRLDREPVARILGRKEFWSLPFRLSPETLVPRPETETVVEAALAAVHDRRNDALRIADLGTGSGAILLALLHELPHAFGIGTDRSAGALATARANAIALGLSPRTAFATCDYSSALGGSFDLIVSNPPYIETGDIDRLQMDVRGHDPRLALDGGPDGLTAYRAIAADARRLLAAGGILVVELGFGQLAAVSDVMANAGLAPKGPVRADIAGIPRALALAVLS
jgi:release factor glutamine methyltransferase